MPKSATDVMQEAMLAAVVDAIVALRTASRGVQNTLLRDLAAIHANTTFADLPAPVQSAIIASVRSGFNRLLKEGYSVSASTGSRPSPKPEGARHSRPARTPRPDPGHPGGARKPPRGNRPQGGRGKPGPRPR
jgi:hypothetical protein